jgi:hypothetical protein
MSEKSILEQALLQINTLEEAVKHNAKGILASTMKQELSDLLKESMEEEEDTADAGFPKKGEEEKDMSEPADDEEAGDENDEEAPSINDEPSKDIDGEDDEDSEEDGEDHLTGLDTNSDDEDEDQDDLEDDGMEGEEGDDETLDMTGASDDEVLKVFKAMSDQDGIIVKKDGDNLEIHDGDNDYIIKLNEEEEEDMEENMYEIELDDEDEDMHESDYSESVEAGHRKATKVKEVEVGEGIEAGHRKATKVKEVEVGEGVEAGHRKATKVKEVEVGEGVEAGHRKATKVKEVEVGENVEAGHRKATKVKEVEVGENARTIGNGYHGGLREKKVGYAGNKREEVNESIISEMETLRKQNSEYKKALVLFKEKLNEVAVFNANLAYATRLFTEHSTTKNEKLDILKRFDTVSNINESKNLYSQITTELGSKKTVTETVVDKLTSMPSTSSSDVLSESKVYEAPQFARMKDLMKKIK